jgi:AAA domain
MSLRVDRGEIARAVALLVEPRGVVELRAPGSHRGTLSGYFDDPGALVDAAASLNGGAPAVYVTLNPVNPALLARAQNRVEPYAKHTTNDGDVTARRWLLLDFDPIRPAGISATDAEHAVALGAARACRTWLCDELGFSQTQHVLADSGNGAHVLVRIDLPNTPESTSLVRRCLEAVALYPGTDTVQVDTSVGNAARISKLYGTVAAKGDSTPERPHRLARILDAPPLEVPAAPTALLERLAALRPVEPRREHARGEDFDVRDWLARHGIQVVREKPWNGGTVLELAECPIGGHDHHPNEAVVIILPGGMVLYTCRHQTCQGRQWSDLRTHFEPARRTQVRRIVDAPPWPTDADVPPTARGTTSAATAPVPPRISRPLSAILADPAALEPPAVVVPRLAWRGRTTLLAAREKAGKSTMATAAAATVTCRAAWLGDPTPGGVVLWVALEEHVADLAGRMGQWPADAARVYVLDSLAGLDDPMASLHREVRDVAPTLLVVDTLSALVDALGSRPDPGSSTAWTPIMAGLTRIARDTDAAVLLLHHARRSDGAYRDSSAIGAGVDVIAEMADGDDADVRLLRVRGGRGWVTTPSDSPAIGTS